jgi:hypothetical protein
MRASRFTGQPATHRISTQKGNPVDDQSVTQAIAKRADELVVGDRIPDEHLPYRFNRGPAEVVFVVGEPGTFPGDEAYTFFAFRYPNGVHESTTVQSKAVLMVFPADPTGLGYSRADDGETTQNLAGRVPPHYGAVVNEGGHTAVEVAGGLIEIDPPDDLPCEMRGAGHPPHDGHVYECCGKVGRISLHRPNCQYRFSPRSGTA